MVAMDEPRPPRGILFRVLFLLVLLVGGPWVGRNVLGTLSWRELTWRTQERVHDLTAAGGPFVDPEVGGSLDFDQNWGTIYSQGRTQFRYTVRTAGAGSARLVVQLEHARRGPEASIRVDDLGLHRDRLLEIAGNLERLFGELDVACTGIEEREVVRVLSGETYEVPDGRSLEIFELGIPATGTAGTVSAEVAVLVDGGELLRHGFGGHRPASGNRVQIGDDMGYTLGALPSVLAGERLTVSENGGQKAYVLGVLGPR